MYQKRLRERKGDFKGKEFPLDYLVSTVGINEEMIKKYVEMQGKEDAGQAELEL